MNDIYLVLPGCDDTNRGDQALVWESVALAKECGCHGDFYILGNKNMSGQSEKADIREMSYILPHPSSRCKDNDNIQYKAKIKIKWALISLMDSIKAILLLSKTYRRIFLRFYSKETQATVDIFKSAKAVFLKGGGFLHSYGGIVNTYSVFYDLYHIIFAQSLHLPVYVLPNSFGPFLSPFSASLVRRVMSKCMFVSARESTSCEVLNKELGIKSDFFPDIAFFLENECDLTEEQIERQKNIPFEKNCVAITVRPYRFPGTENPTEKYQNYKTAICKFMEQISRRGFYPVLVEHTYSVNKHEQDICCIKDIQKMINNSFEYGVFSDRTLNCRQLKFFYSKFRYTVGTRFHSVIFSLSCGVPSIAIGYGGNKAQGIMKDMGLIDCEISIDGITAEKLISLFDSLIKNEADISERISTYLTEIKDRKQELIQCIQQIKNS